MVLIAAWGDCYLNNWKSTPNPNELRNELYFKPDFFIDPKEQLNTGMNWINLVKYMNKNRYKL